MGTLRSFDLSQYGCNVYVETGTGRCESLGKAAQTFDRCYSVDLDLDLVKIARQQYPNLNIECGLSTDVLEQWLKSGELLDSDCVLFYLDAHFPGADFRGERHDVSAPNAVPLQRELELIRQYRPNARDYIICDDARIYMLGPFELGNVEWLQVPGGLNFVYQLFDSDRVSIDYTETGYILIDQR